VHRAEILADSVTAHGARLTTIRLTIPRIVLGELTRHRAFSFCVASTRAEALGAAIKRAERAPYVPDEWPADGRGMSPRSTLPDHLGSLGERWWRDLGERAIATAATLGDLGLHKEIAGRVLEPWQWSEVVVSGTEWANFLRLRCAPDCSRPLRLGAERVREALAASTPAPLGPGEWHLPLVSEEERRTLGDDAIGVSAARVARVSYRGDPRSADEDLRLAARLRASQHMSPFEHTARPLGRVETTQRLLRTPGVSSVDPDRIQPGTFPIRNFCGWVQARVDLEEAS